MNVQMNAYVMLDGEAAEAISFYEKTLGAKTVFLQSYGDGPEEEVRAMSEEEKKRVAHAVLKAGDSELFIADSMPGKPFAKGDAVNICLTIGDAETAGLLFERLRDGGQVLMPLQALYFSPAYGMVRDKFGVTFQIFTRRSQAR